MMRSGSIITLRQAKRQVEVGDDDTSRDEQLDELREIASMEIIEFCEIDTDDTGFDWFDELGEPLYPPRSAIGAALLQLGAHFENRDGDDWRSPLPLSTSVKNLLIKLTGPHVV